MPAASDNPIPVSLRGKAGRDEGDSPVLMETTGQLRVALYTPSNAAVQVSGNTDTEAATGNNPLRVEARQVVLASDGSGSLVWERVRGLKRFTPVALGAATAEATIWTPTTGKKFRLMWLVLTASAQTVLTFKDNTAGTTILTVELAANTPHVLNLANGILSAAANNVLTVTRGTSATLNGTLAGTEE